MEGNHAKTNRWLSQDLSALIVQQSQHHEIYDLVIVGSGYGGAMAAAELAGMKDGEGRTLKICLLERGKEYLPGSFPSQMGELPGHVRVSTPMEKKPKGFGDGLFDVRIGPDVCALVASGLGGGSLINAGVMEIPKWGDFADRLPADVLKYLQTADYAGIKQTLGAVNKAIEQHPRVGTANPLDRTLALQALDPGNFTLHDHLERPFKPAKLFRQAAVTIKMSAADEANLKQCTLCGDCMTGCNIGAKKSLDTNLLLRAHDQQVEIYTGATVLKLTRERSPGMTDSLWQLHVVHSDEDCRKHQATPLPLRARKVILAAGALGSPEILLRSRNNKLQFSSRLGQQFSCNGDNIATYYKLHTPVNAVADENMPITEGKRRIGPTITGMLDVPATPERQGFLLQEFAIPGPMAHLFSEVVTTANTLHVLPAGDMKRHLPASDPGTLDPCAVDDAAIGYSSLIGIIGHDSSSGVLRLEQDERHTQNHDGMIRIAWPDARYGKTINDAMHYLEHLSKQEDGLLQADGRLIPNPLWQIGPEALTDLIAQPRGPVLTVHPLGGCPMGTCVEDGVVDQYGMVFNAQQNQPPGTRKNKAEMDDWQGSLFVLDGSIIPASLGANPALTIATLSQRASQHLRTQWLKAPAPLLPSAPPGAMQSAPVAAGPRPIFRAPEDCISPARPTKLKMAERLVGNMLIYRDDGVMDDYWVELTLHYEAIELRKLMSTLKRHVTLEVPSATSGSSIRIFHKDDWAQLEFGSERERDAKALLKASLTGTLEIFDQEASTVGCRITRSLWAWFRNRGLRDLSQRAIEAWNEPGNKLDKLWNLPKATLKKGKEFFNIASHAGQVRRLDYKLTIGAGQVRHDSNVFKHRPYQGLHLCGEKRLTYARRANPLRQLSDLHITDFPSMPGGVNAKLSLDLRFVALQEIPLAQIVAQKNQITALADIASFGLYILRLMLLTHIWTFRKPDPSPTRKPERLPQALPKAVRAGSEWKDLEPEITEIDLRPAVRNTLAPGNKPGDDIPVRVRLSRFRKPNVCDACRTDLKPLILIHGYSASGSTFAHPAIGTSMAQYFVERCRDVWILDLRTSAGMPSAVLPWHFEDAALEDIPVAIAHILRVTGADQVDIFAHCIGATMLSMAILTDPAKIEDVFPHDLVAWPKPPRRFYRQELALMQNSIRRIVLSQKGPALVYTADNMLRAWIMRSLRELLLPDNFQFSVEEDASLRDQLVDRWLNVLPYPEEEFDAENPFLWHKPWQWGKRTPWVGFRHRMDALYARDFSVNNLDEITLNAIDDLFGPLNLETVSQAIHFVRANKITDAYGRNQFVSRANLQAHWSRVEHTMSIHGAKNGLVDKETLKRMTALMQDANIRFTAHEAFEDFGHQDMLIGRDNIKVFEEIEKFLAAPASAGTQAIAAGFTPGLVCDLPWLGPRLEAHPDEQNRVAVMSDPKIGNAMVLCIPVRPGSKGGFELPAGYRTPIVPERAPAYHWVNYQVPDELLTLDSVTAYLVVMLYEEAGAASQTIPTIGPEPDPLTKAPLLPDPEPVQPDQLVAILHSLQQQYDSDSEAFASALLSKDEIITPIGKGSAAPVSLVLAFGSCQYPVGLMDRPVAQASIERLAHRLRLLPPHVQDPATLKPELLLLLGDQIYSDATAGLLDPSRADARYLRPHEDWLRMPPLREVMRKIPVYCMLDDHEIIDNWSPLRAHAKSWHMTQGRKYYRQFQPRVSNPLPLQQGSQDLWCAFLHKGIPFFMCDTRTERMERKAGNAQHASIMEKRQMRALKHWLIRNCDPTQPKIISSASILLPRHVASASDSLHQDGWEGFPASLYEILAFIGENQIHNVIFLSGDEHVSSVTDIELWNADKSRQVKALSLHSSGFYAPFPFANALPASVRTEDAFSFTQPASDTRWHCSTQTHIIGQGDGFMVLKLAQVQGGWQLDLEFDGARGQTPWRCSKRLS